MDLIKAEKAMKDFLEALDQDLTDPNLVDTPKRVSKMFAEEIINPKLMDVKLTTFETKKSGNQFIVVTNMTVASTCSHHLLPISGVAHVGVFFIADENNTTYLPGLSKYARIVEAYSRKLQLQERLTNEIGEAILTNFNADLVYVLVDAEHWCMKHRGVELQNSETMTSTLLISDKFKEHNFSSGQFINDFYNQLNIRLKK